MKLGATLEFLDTLWLYLRVIVNRTTDAPAGTGSGCKAHAVPPLYAPFRSLAEALSARCAKAEGDEPGYVLSGLSFSTGA
jgi:hypothetical protein